MIVLKFGGSSVADATRISAMMDIVHEALKRDRVILVSSAISGCTDYLLGNEDFKPLFDKHLAIIDRLFTGQERYNAILELENTIDDLEKSPKDERVTFGELLSTQIIARRFFEEDIETLWLDSRKLIKVDSDGKVVEAVSYELINNAIGESSNCRLFVAPGFIASTLDGKVTTLGRGGSDYSAALYAAAVGASALEIWTDVPGIMTANPKDVPAAVTVPFMSYDAAFTLAENGAKVLYAPTVQPAREAGIAINIRNTFDPRNPGTVISSDRSVEQWCGVSALRFEQKSRICLVGENILNREKVGSRILNALNNNGISSLSEVYGEGSVFFVEVSSLVVNEAVSAIHTEFFVDSAPTNIDVYIAGNGAVAKALISLIESSSERIAARTGKAIRIAGQSNSRCFTLGSSLPVIASENSECGNLSDSFIEAICASAPRHSVFIDCTNDENLYTQYIKLFRRGVNIVTSNRRSLAIPYTQYAGLKAAARESGCFFRYDTTVGTSLPILESIASSANCSDEIESIEAVVSCTMNNLFTSYTGEGKSFATLLREAQESGLTEKDPRIDLEGKDVLRKLLVIAREAGVALEDKDVEIIPMFEPEFFDCSLEEFYTKLEESENDLAEQISDLRLKGKRLRFIASLHKDSSSPLGYKADIQMFDVGASSPFFWLNGTENVIIINSAHSAPLVIKGAGEGAKQAAIGIIKDILS